MQIPGDSQSAGEFLTGVEHEVVECQLCARLVKWRSEIAITRKAAYRDQEYWGAGIAGFGDPGAQILVLGLAPAAHGANRTGRMFTGDRSGDWLFRALYKVGLASQAQSISRDDGLELADTWVTSAVKCAPPQNAPTASERLACAPYLAREIAALGGLRVVVCLGAFGWTAACAHFGLRPRPRFGHGVEEQVPSGPLLIGSFHPSQQNTFTGRLTEEMFDAVFSRAVQQIRSEATQQ